MCVDTETFINSTSFEKLIILKKKKEIKSSQKLRSLSLNVKKSIKLFNFKMKSEIN